MEITNFEIDNFAELYLLNESFLILFSDSES